MADTVTKIGITFETFGDTKIKKAFGNLGKEVSVLKRNFGSLSDKSIKKVKDQLLTFNKVSGNSINSMQAQKTALVGLRNMADTTGAEFKQLTADIAKLDAKMRQATIGTTGFKGKLKNIGKIGGAIGAAGIFGGAEGLIGATIGGIAGGLPGAVAGGVIGSQLGILREQISTTADYSAKLRLQREALALVIGDTNKLTEAQRFLTQVSKDLAIPQDVITRQFTSLTASVVGAGFSVEDAEDAFEAIAAGIRGTGGSLEDMKSAMRATSQVFSKGKVSAEELRQQLGERLPGAFTLFAESMNKTPAELDKALEQGKVTLDDFMNFTKLLTEKYGENAKLLADSPAAAGDRLQTAMSRLKDNLGQILTPIGAGFQDTFTIIVNVIDKAVVGLKNFLKIGEEFEKEKLDKLKVARKEQEDELKRYKGILETAEAFLKEFRAKRDAGEDITDEEYKKAQRMQNIPITLPNKIGFIEKNIKNIDIEIAVIENNLERMNIKLDEGKNKTNDLKDTSINAFKSMGDGVKQYLESIKDINKQIADATVNAFKSMEDALVNFVITGKLNFRSLAQSIIADITRMIIRQQMFNLLSGLTGGFNLFGGKEKAVESTSSLLSKDLARYGSSVPAGSFGIGSKATDIINRVPSNPSSVFGSRNAMGNVFANNKIVPYAYGGIVDKPTIFPMARGIGLMGEAGAEAIMPLKRGKDGKLGVQSSGGIGNISVNVNATGSSVEGDSGQASQLGKMLGMAVQAELIRQKRPGGLLS